MVGFAKTFVDLGFVPIRICLRQKIDTGVYDQQAYKKTVFASMWEWVTLVLIFNGELTPAPERSLRGRHGHGKVDYSIESLADDGTRHIFGVIEVKQEDFRKSMAQNHVQLESSLTVRKRKRCDDDEGERVAEVDESVPMNAYGIVTDAVNWYFLECRIDQSGKSSSRDPMRPKFKISKLDDIVNYRKSTAQEHPSESDLLKIEILRLNQVIQDSEAARLERETVLEERLKTVQGRLNTCSREKTELQEKHNALVEALLDKDALSAELTALHKEYKDLLEKCLRLEASQGSRRSSLDTSVTQEDLSSSLASLAALELQGRKSSSLALSPATRKKYTPESCTECGFRVYKHGKRPNEEICTCGHLRLFFKKSLAATASAPRPLPTRYRFRDRKII
ncbi:hypothetical protein BGZ80_001297 [Entomortierella chlamydospora]|uniref:Uncharacterized protein n=1 Tax=Entomortierella chlamydospora TaxID=101097 RepID=A0A9P6SYE7_9FUNG|nr:hypothetical protein BGZ80_001297 [Entomortierella chlamydospora]